MLVMDTLYGHQMDQVKVSFDLLNMGKTQGSSQSLSTNHMKK